MTYFWLNEMNVDLYNSCFVTEIISKSLLDYKDVGILRQRPKFLQGTPSADKEICTLFSQIQHR